MTRPTEHEGLKRGLKNRHILVAALVINWTLISLTHLKARKAMVAAGHKLVFKSIGFPLANWICLAFMAMVLGILAFTPGLSMVVWLVPMWLFVMWLGYAAKRRASHAVPAGAGRS